MIAKRLNQPAVSDQGSYIVPLHLFLILLAIIIHIKIKGLHLIVYVCKSVLWCYTLFRCIPFPHSHLYCGQYIDASTVVYIDPIVFNYTEINDAIRMASNTGIFGDRIINGDSCIKQVPYMICQYVYPRCSNTTQALLPVCVDDCVEKTEMCAFYVTALESSASLNPLFGELVINCTNQFAGFGSVTVDSENCYNYYGKAYSTDAYVVQLT